MRARARRSPIHQRGAAAAAMLGEPTKAQIAEAYQLTQPAGASNSKKQKKTRNPKDLSARDRRRQEEGES